MVLGVFVDGLAADSVEWDIQKTLQLEAAPIDVAVTPDGRRIFVLTGGGEILIYSSTAQIEGKINVGPHVDQMKLGPRGESLILSSRANKTVEIVTFDFIQKINVSGSPFRGEQDAPVVIAIFSDFQWPYCARLVPVLEQVLEKNPTNVKIVFKNFPIRSHKFAVKAALAALAAESKGKFWEFHDLLFKNYNKINDKLIDEIALGLGFNKEEFEKKMTDPSLQQRIQQDALDGRQAGVRGTPTIFVNGRRLRDRTLKGFQAAIDKELQKLSSKDTKTGS